MQHRPPALPQWILLVLVLMVTGTRLGQSSCC